MTDREQLFQELEHAPDEVIAATLNFLRSTKATPEAINAPIAQSQSPEDRIQQLRDWIATLPKNATPLPEEALHRDSMYD